MRLISRCAALLLLIIITLLLLPIGVFAEDRVDGCQCTDYVYSQRPDIPTGMGHAKDWLYSSRIYRLPYDQVPQVGDVAVILQGDFGFNAEFGHVAMVIEVNESRSEFSIAGWDGLKNDCQLNIFHNLPVTNNTYFIHQTIKTDLSSIPHSDWPHFNQILINLAVFEYQINLRR
jgi:surface antigen